MIDWDTENCYTDLESCTYHAAPGSQDSIIIRRVRLTERGVKEVLKVAKGIKSVSFENPPEAVWWLAFINGELLGTVCCVIKRNSARFKSDFIIESARGKGVYSILSKLRITYAEDAFCHEATCFSTPFSRPKFLKDGFEIETTRGDICYMRKIL